MFQLDYILLHFHSLYPGARHTAVGYGTEPGDSCRVSIRKYSGNFFQQKKARTQQVVWKEWGGVQLPFFFEADAAAELVTYHPDGTATINYDIIASGFYLLSGWQEYHGVERDRFGRYTYGASVQAKHGFIQKPIVNYYFELLRQVLEQVYKANLSHNVWGKSAFATCLTSDIDRLHSAWKVAGLPLLQKGRWLESAKLLTKKISGKDAWDNLKQVAAAGPKVTFFFLPSNQSYNGHPNADYDLAKPRYQEQLKALAAAGHEVALHGSFGTANDLVQLKADALKLAEAPKGNRFHYLCYQPDKTPQLLQQSNLAYDTTLGFAEHIGFRNSYCHPFYPFDFRNRKAYTYLELPLLLMDTTLYGPHYMHLKPGQAMAAIEPVLQEVSKFGGLFTLLWHNENFSDFSEQPAEAGELTWRQLLQELLQKLEASGSAFFTCSEAAAKIKV